MRKSDGFKVKPEDVKMVANGKVVRLTDLPLVAYRLSCAHTSRGYAVFKGDIIFCDGCKSSRKVSSILA